MDQATINALLGAGALLAIALMGFLTAFVRQRTNELTAHLQVITKQTMPRFRGGGGGAVFPTWNQLTDAGVGGVLPTGRYEECGEECCSMVIMQQHGVQTAADVLRTLLGGPSRGPLTTAADLARLLGMNNVTAAVQPADSAHVAQDLQDVCARGGCAIALGTFVAPGVLHWILVTRADNVGCGANDPWMGRRRIWTWEAFRPLFAGDLVVVTRPPDAR